MKPANFKFKALLIATLLHTLMLIALFWGIGSGNKPMNHTSLWQGGDVAYINLDLSLQTGSGTTSLNPSNAPEKPTHTANLNTAQSTKSATPPQPQSSAVQTGNFTVGDGIDSAGSTSPNTLALIRKKIAQNKIIPTDADAQPLSGTVKVGFQINANGQIEALAILKSSGTTALDQAALKTIQRAAPLPHFKNPIAIDLEYQ